MKIARKRPLPDHAAAASPRRPLSLLTRSQLRGQLKKAHGVNAGTVECVYSSEEQVTEMLPLSKEQAKNPEEFGVVDKFRCGAVCQGGRRQWRARWSARLDLILSAALSAHFGIKSRGVFIISRRF